MTVETRPLSPEMLQRITLTAERTKEPDRLALLTYIAHLTRQRDEALRLLKDAQETARRALDERDEAQKNYRFMVDRAADEKLDGYRELGQRAAIAENERDEAIAALAADNARLREALMAFPTDFTLGGDYSDIERQRAEALDATQKPTTVKPVDAMLHITTVQWLTEELERDVARYPAYYHQAGRETLRDLLVGYRAGLERLRRGDRFLPSSTAMDYATQKPTEVEGDT